MSGRGWWRRADPLTLVVLAAAAVAMFAVTRFPPDLARGQQAPSPSVAAAPPMQIQDFDFVFNYARWATTRPGVSPYTYDAHRGFYAAWLGPKIQSALVFPYGPIAMLMLAPLYWLTAPAAWLCWNLAGAYGVAWTVGGMPEERRARSWARLAGVSPTAIHTLALGQTALVTTALAAAAVELVREPRRWFVCGLCLVLLSIKPPLAIVIGVAFLLAGFVRPVGLAAVGAGLLVSAAMAWWTPAVAGDYADIVRHYNLVDADPIVRSGCTPHLMSNLRGVLMRSGVLDDSQAFLASGWVLGALLLLPLAGVALTRRTWPPELAVGWTVMAYLLFAPHVSSTEDLLLLVPFGVLTASDRLGSGARACVAVGCIAPQWLNGALLALVAPVRGAEWTSVVPIVPFVLKLVAGIAVARTALRTAMS